MARLCRLPVGALVLSLCREGLCLHIASSDEEPHRCSSAAATEKARATNLALDLDLDDMGLTPAFGRKLQLPPAKKSTNILLIGSSLDHSAVRWACRVAEARTVKHPEGDKDMQRFFEHCSIGNYTFGFFQNWGSGEPPYWGDLYKNPPHCIPSSLHVHSKDHISLDAVAEAERMFGTASPDVVVVDSSVWDLTNAGPLAENIEFGDFLRRWCNKEHPDLMRWVSRAFPKSRVVYRTIPTMNGEDAGCGPESLGWMSECLTERYTPPSRQPVVYDAVDYRKIVQDLLDSGMALTDVFPGRAPQIHPGMEASLRYIELISTFA